jgi:predicted O-methyltransferase YrrM
VTTLEIAERASAASNMRFPGESDIRAFGLQKLDELFLAVTYLSLDPPAKVLEVGSAAGGTFLAWCAVAIDEAVLVSVDLQQFDADCELMRSYAQLGQSVHFIRGDSHAPETKRAVQEISETFDFLFIDADHSGPAVRADWADYSPLVRDGGLVAFHDIADGGPIGELWSELSRQYRSVKFVENEHDGWGGIGVLKV